MLPLYQKYGLTGFVFDFDGTLAVPTLDFAYMREQTLAVVAHMGARPVPHGMPLMEQLQHLCTGLSPADSELLLQKAFQTIEDIELAAAARSSLFPFVRPMLAAFKEKGIVFAIITRNCREAVQTVFPDVTSHCACLLTRDDVPREKVKPHPTHLQTALDVLGLSAGQVMMVGDHPMDIEVGKKVKALTAGVASGEASLSLLQQHTPTLTARDGEELMHALGILEA